MISSLNEGITGFIESIIKGAQQLGELSVTSVWAFFSLMLLGYIFYDLKAKRDNQKEGWNARLKEADADSLMASAVEKMANEIKELRYRMDRNGGGHAQ